jgi:hypothetical protein
VTGVLCFDADDCFSAAANGHKPILCVNAAEIDPLTSLPILIDSKSLQQACGAIIIQGTLLSDLSKQCRCYGLPAIIRSVRFRTR